MQDFRKLMEAISEKYNQLLGKNLIGIYVHGSIAFDCFHWDRSDIDFIVVIHKPIPQPTKLQLLQVLADLKAQAPPRGFEMSIVLEKYCKAFVHKNFVAGSNTPRNSCASASAADSDKSPAIPVLRSSASAPAVRKFIYPTPYELNFSSGWNERYLSKQLALREDERRDADLAAHFMVIKHVGLVIYGAPIEDVFGAVPREAYIDSICKDLVSAKEYIADDPGYIVLNLCRAYAYISGGLVLSKEQGGKWGLENLPQKYHNLISAMLGNYVNGSAFANDEAQRIQFVAYMLELILGKTT